MKIQVPRGKLKVVSWLCEGRCVAIVPTELDIYRKRISNVLGLLGFKIIIYTKVVNFLDVRLNLWNGTFGPYEKENDTPIYTLTSLNHPPSIIKQIPKPINRRLSDNSSNMKISIKCKHIYDNALRYSG